MNFIEKILGKREIVIVEFDTLVSKQEMDSFTKVFRSEVCAGKPFIGVCTKTKINAIHRFDAFI